MTKLPGQKAKRAWHAIYERDRGSVPAGMELHHQCHNPRCVNPAHLKPVTPSEHRKLHGKGSVTPAALSEARRLLALGFSQRKVAAQVGVSRVHLRRCLGLE